MKIILVIVLHKKITPSFEEEILHIEYIWWAHLGLNQGPTGYEPAALTAEL